MPEIHKAREAEVKAWSHWPPEEAKPDHRPELIGGVVLLLLIAGVAVWRFRRKKRRDDRRRQSTIDTF